MAIKIIKDASGSNVKFEGIDRKPIPVNSYLCGVAVSNGGITIFNPDSPLSDGSPSKVMHKVPYTEFVKADGSVPISAEDLKADIDAQLTQAAPTDVNVGYKGHWNASTNTPDLTNSFDIGDWFYVGVPGTYGGVNYNINDIIKYNNTSFDLIPNPNVRIDDIEGSAINEYDVVVDADYTGSINTGSSLQPYVDLVVAIANSSPSNSILVKGINTITTEIVLPHSLSFYGANGAEIKYDSYNSANGSILSFEGNGTQKFIFKGITFKNAGGYGLLIKKTDVTQIRNCEFFNCGWDGTGLNTIAPSATSGLLGYDSLSVDLQAFYAGSNASNGGAVRIQECRKPLLRESRAENNLRGFRLQDCGINGGGFVIENQSLQNIESGIYLAAGSLGGCQNITVTVNYSSYNANNGLLCIGGINNKFSQNEVNGNWNAGLCSWGSTNLTLRDSGLYDNNRSQFNGIGNTGDAKASIQINDANSFIATSITWNPAARFIAEILDTQVHYTGLGSSSEKIGFLITEGVGQIDDDDKNIIKVDDVGFIGQDYAIDLSEVDTTNLRLSLGDNSYQSIGQKAVKEPLNGYYYELPYSNHSMNHSEIDLSISNTGNIIIKEGPMGSSINPYSVNDLQALAHGSKVKVILKGSKKIQFIVPVDGLTIEGILVNSVLSLALVQLNDLFTNTTGFASGGNPVTAFDLTGNNLTITLQDGISYTVDVTSLGVDENKFVSSGALNGSNLELTMNDSSIITIDASNMINGSALPAISNNWYVAYGSISGTEITAPRLTNSIKNVMPLYNGEALAQGQEYIWNHDDTGTLHIGTWAGSTSNATGTNSGLDVHWGIKFKIEGSSVGGGRNIVCPVTDSSVTTHSVGVDIDSNFLSGYSITNSTVFSIRYSEDNFLYLYDISNGTDIFICKSLLPLDGNPIFLHITGQTTSVQTRIPVLIERFIDWNIVHDFDNSETSIKDGIEDHTVIRTNLTIDPGEKLMMNLIADGRSNYFGTGYTGASSGNSLAETSLENRWIYGTSEQIFSANNWTNNTNAQYWDENLGGSGAWQIANGVNSGMVSWRYQSNNILELWSEDVGELIMTCDVPMDGNPIHIFYGVRENTLFNHFPTISKQQIGQGSQPISYFAPDISNQSFDITEGDAFNVQIVLDLDSDIVNIYGEENSPSWALLNQSTGDLFGTAPTWSNSDDDINVINCKAANALGGITSFQVTLNVVEQTYTNTKSLNFEEGVNSYLGGNAALVTALERAGNGNGAVEAWSIGIWAKRSENNTGQTMFYFGHNDIANNGHIELKQTSGDRIRLRYGSTNNYLQLQTASGSLNSGWNYILVTYDGGTTGSSSGSLNSYYSRFKIFINGVEPSKTTSQGNYGWSGGITGQNFRIGRLVAGNYPKGMRFNQISIWNSDQSSNATGLYNGGSTQDISTLAPGVGNMNTNYLPPDHYYEIENSTTTIQDLIGASHLIGYNFNSSDLVDDAP